jgi:hypothetical protein
MPSRFDDRPRRIFGNRARRAPDDFLWPFARAGLGAPRGGSGRHPNRRRVLAEGQQYQPVTRQDASLGLDPDGFDVQVFVEMLQPGLASIATAASCGSGRFAAVPIACGAEGLARLPWDPWRWLDRCAWSASKKPSRARCRRVLSCSRWGQPGPRRSSANASPRARKKLARSPVSMSRSPAPVALGEKFALHNEKDLDKESDRAGDDR